jgi:hypothetical protein
MTARMPSQSLQGRIHGVLCQASRRFYTICEGLITVGNQRSVLLSPQLTSQMRMIIITVNANDRRRWGKTMGYYIYAWLEHGNPRLRVVDIRTGSTCLRWDYRNSGRTNFNDKKEIQRLFRDLLLLTCRQENQNIRMFNIRPIPATLPESETWAWQMADSDS